MHSSVAARCRPYSSAKLTSWTADAVLVQHARQDQPSFAGPWPTAGRLSSTRFDGRSGRSLRRHSSSSPIAPRCRTSCCDCAPPGAAPGGADNLAARAAELVLRQTGAAAGAFPSARQTDSSRGRLGRWEQRRRRRPASAQRSAGSRSRRPSHSRPGRARRRRAAVRLRSPSTDDWGRRDAQTLGRHTRAPIVDRLLGNPAQHAAVYAKYDDLLTMSDPLSTIRASVQEPLRRGARAKAVRYREIADEIGLDLDDARVP